MMTIDDQAQIRAILDRYRTALSDSDVDAAVAEYAADGAFYPYNLPTATGTEELLASYRQIFSAIKLDVAFTVHRIEIVGDLAYVTTESASQVTVLEPGITAAEENRELFVFTRIDGEWKIAQYMFNKPAAPPAPGS